ALVPVVYDELRRIARRHLRGEAVGHTLTTTALVHEAYLRLVNAQNVPEENRTRFLVTASVAMRRVLVDYARAHRAEKRGGGVVPVELHDALQATTDDTGRLLELDEALERLAAIAPRLAQVVECRFFGGMTEDDTATALGISLRTVRRDWLKAKGWLAVELAPDGSASPPPE
ncbi:MAG: sigma-70 family RNA polymerase sigma factor, partial [Gemmatimonadetes bacterium]|nr:sigma-70 family RNA polymerase sigma factor [Gemmatimonadota bacterium]